jgi:MoaA/NifB/PqqE/SkfB family radical SAM enzyme
VSATRRPLAEDMLERERVANRAKHWVRLATACNSHCLFCLDSDTPRDLIVPAGEVRRELRRGREELGAAKVILSGGEASLHPDFAALVAYARSIGYERVQTVTNGWRWAERPFYEAAVRAGLGEITFSLHGNTEELHDRLTQHPGSFRRLVKALVRAVRDPRVIANVDVVVNRQNVAVLDRIVELAISLGVTEFDLLHVIPQASAYENREAMFYDPREQLPVLHKVFRLNRHPGFVIWTNRFPVSYLEGMEDLIQDPHKMLDEVNGRRFQVRRYLDEGIPLDCRQRERCVHCFIEPFCTTMDRVVRSLHRGPAGVPGSEQPFGDVETTQLDAERAAWLLDHAEHVRTHADRIRIVQRSWETLAEARAHDVRDPGAFFAELRRRVGDDALRRVRVSGLPACLAEGTSLDVPPLEPPADLFEADTGRLGVRALARFHVQQGYRVKSLRCRDCRVDARCEGIHVNMARDQGLRLCRPLRDGAWAEDAAEQLRAIFPEPDPRVADGRPPEPVAPSLPGFPPPRPAPRDPLAALALERDAARARRRAALQVLNGPGGEAPIPPDPA